MHFPVTYFITKISHEYQNRTGKKVQISVASTFYKYVRRCVTLHVYDYYESQRNETFTLYTCYLFDTSRSSMQWLPMECKKYQLRQLHPFSACMVQTWVLYTGSRQQRMFWAPTWPVRLSAFVTELQCSASRAIVCLSNDAQCDANHDEKCASIRLCNNHTCSLQH